SPGNQQLDHDPFSVLHDPFSVLNERFGLAQRLIDPEVILQLSQHACFIAGWVRRTQNLRCGADAAGIRVVYELAAETLICGTGKDVADNRAILAGLTGGEQPSRTYASEQERGLVSQPVNRFPKRC